MKKKIITGIIVAGLMIPSISHAQAFGIGTPSEEEIRLSKLEDRMEEALNFCYMTADKDKNKVTTIEEEKQMWIDMGYHLREYTLEQTGAETFETIWPKNLSYQEEIHTYESYLKNNKVTFEFDYKTNKYTITKGLKTKKSSLRK